MNQYYNYKKWRLARIADAPLNNPEHTLTTPLGHNYEAAVTDYIFDPTKEDYRLYSPSVIDEKENNPQVYLNIPKATHQLAHNLMHHVLGLHDRIMPYINPYQEGGRVSITHETSEPDGYTVEDKGKDNKFSSVKIGGKINSASGIADKLSQAFSGILLHYLNRNAIDINHPAIDTLIDSPDLEHNPHVNISQADLSGPRGDRLKAHNKLADYHRQKLRGYLEEHLKDPFSTKTYSEFLDNLPHFSSEEASIHHLLKNILEGRYTKFSPMQFEPKRVDKGNDL